jgi:hypothetical protein
MIKLPETFGYSRGNIFVTIKIGLEGNYSGFKGFGRNVSNVK